MIDLGTLGGSFTGATGVNNRGQVVGFSTTTSGNRHAFLYSKSTGMQDLGWLGGSYSDSVAKAVNIQGQVAGSSSAPGGETHAFLYSASTGMIDINTLGTHMSFANAINRAGQVVGYFYDPTTGAQRAFLYSNGAMVDLASLLATGSGWTLSKASGINDEGQIVGYGINAVGQQHAFLLTPGKSNSPYVLHAESH